MKKELILNLLEDSDLNVEQNYTEETNKQIHFGTVGGFLPVEPRPIDKIQ